MFIKCTLHNLLENESTQVYVYNCTHTHTMWMWMCMCSWCRRTATVTCVHDFGVQLSYYGGDMPINSIVLQSNAYNITYNVLNHQHHSIIRIMHRQTDTLVPHSIFQWPDNTEPTNSFEGVEFSMWLCAPLDQTILYICFAVCLCALLHTAANDKYEDTTSLKWHRNIHSESVGRLQMLLSAWIRSIRAFIDLFYVSAGHAMWF